MDDATGAYAAGMGMTAGGLDRTLDARSLKMGMADVPPWPDIVAVERKSRWVAIDIVGR